MGLQIKTIESKSIWEEFISQHPEANFLQSWAYGECFSNLGLKVFRFGIYNGENLVGVYFLLKEIAKRGSYLSIAGGPILDWKENNLVEFFTKEIKKFAKEQKVHFVRMRPQCSDNLDLKSFLKTLGWQKSAVNLEAELTCFLDLTQSDEAILKAMTKDHRYELRKADKVGITTKISTDIAELDEFCQYQHELGKKQGFRPFSDRLIVEQFKAFACDNQVVLVNSYLKEKLLASAYIIFYNGQAAYHYGISTPDNYGLPGAYACQWAVICEAKKRGISLYNLWGGLVPTGFVGKHRYSGINRFKRGFGAYEFSYFPAHDLVISPFYYVTRMFEWARKKMRRL